MTYLNLKKYLKTYAKLFFVLVLFSVIIDYFYFKFNIAQSIKHNITNLHWHLLSVIIVSIFYTSK